MGLNSLSVNSTVSDNLGEFGDYLDLTAGYYYDYYQLTNLAPGYAVNVSLASDNFDAFLGIYNSNTGQYIGVDNDGGAGTNSQFSFTPVFGDQDGYYAVVSSFGHNSTGDYYISASYV